MFNFVRVVCAVPDVSVADTDFNTSKILEKLSDAEKIKADFVVFPELSITGYTCQDLFFQKELTQSALSGLLKITKISKSLNSVILVGLPLCVKSRLYNAAAVIFKGKIYGFALKSFIPNYNEFQEKRWFSSAFELSENVISSKDIGILEEYDIPIGNNLIFDIPNKVKFAADICEDLFNTIPPSSLLSLGGAELIFNLSASDALISKKEYVRNLVKVHSSSTLSAYVYTSAGATESTQDLVFSGNSIICENGAVLEENETLCSSDYILSSDIDLEKIRADRLKINSFHDAENVFSGFREIKTVILPEKEFLSDGTLSKSKKMPFVPEDKEILQKRCLDIFKMQTEGLKKRLIITGAKPVIGVSGGLDSTLALLVCVAAQKALGKPLSDVWGITMPCFGTSGRTYNNSLALMRALNISYKEINIKDACLMHFEDIGHNKDIHDLTYENTQARERTQVLMDFAGEVGGLVVGTGDLSELALGWCTYNADHMSMYGVNSGIPKTLIKYIIKSLTESGEFSECADILKDIIDTPISPELLPPDKDGKIAQETENLVGPYVLHDFFLYNILRYGFSPEKVYYLAKLAFKDEFDNETILKWLKNFYRRFFTQQFKRSCLPDGIKIGSIGLSPRGDFKMPSDASSKIWLDKVENLSE